MQKRRKKLIILTIFLVLILAITLYFQYIAMPIVCTLAAQEIRAEVVNIINEANSYLQSLSLFYDSYFKIHYDNNSKISAITANTGLINQVSMILQKQVQNRLNQLRTKTINLPLGSFSGNSLLAPYGVNVPLSVKTVCNCYASTDSGFESVGINQVRHRLVVTLHVDIKIVIPMRSTESTAFNDIVMAESVIVGEVPETYLTEGTSDYLDLVP
ncbi:MAG TPA: sporulation protein YunB [Clostridia bacterium]|jgi:sporulation protein YunB|nr:sporulation protein YunB [Clostridia bacterium]